MNSKRAYSRLASKLESLRLDPDRDWEVVYKVFTDLGDVQEIPDAPLAKIDYTLLNFLDDLPAAEQDRKKIIMFSKGVGQEVWHRSSC
jgi:hypothetical protein